MAPGCLKPDASALSLFRSDGLNNAQTSELGRLSTGKGGLPHWPLDRSHHISADQQARKRIPPQKPTGGTAAEHIISSKRNGGHSL